MTEALRKERDHLCKQIDRAMNNLSQVKEAIEHGNIDEASKLVMPLKTIAANLPNDVKYYVERSKFHRV
jgi:hypothetical protein